MGKFQGFPEDGIKFLKQIKRNNDREWFAERKEKYETLLKQPMLDLTEDLAAHFREKAPEIKFAPRGILRIYRDTRFSKDKTPLKTFVGASFSFVGYPKGVSSPGVYFQVSPEEAFTAGGLYMPDARQLTRLRYSIDQNPDAFLGLIENRAFKKYFDAGLEGERLKRAPQGYLPDHPMIEELKRKQFYVSKTFKVADCTKPKFLTQVADSFERMIPIIRWLARSSV